MAGQSNFQDVVQLNQDTLSVLGNQIQLGSGAGSKSIVFAQDPAGASGIYLAASNATGAETIIIPDANGTLGLITAISAGGALFSNGQLVFSNSNSISFGIAGGTITASFGETGVGAFAAGTQTATAGTVIFSNSNGISFGMSNSSIVTASFDGIRSVGAGGATAGGSILVFNNANGVSFGQNAGTITASIAAGAAVVSGFGVSTGGNTLGNTGTVTNTIVLAAIGNITLSQVTGVGGATISISGSQSTAPGAVAAGGSTLTNGSLVFTNLNNISFGFNGSTLSASFSTADVTGIGLTNLGNTAGNTGTTFGRMVFAGGGIITLSQATAAGSLATITISASLPPALGALGAGTQTNSTGTVIFSNSNGVSFGMSNSSVVTASYDGIRSISVNGSALGGSQIVFSNSNGVSFGANGQTITLSIVDSTNNIAMASQWAEFGTNWSISQASLSFQRAALGRWLTVTGAAVLMDMAGATNSTGALTISLGIYSLAGSTASLVSSGSRLISWTTGALTTASSIYGGVSGTRYRTINVNWNITPGDYMLAVAMSTSNNGNWKVFGRQGPQIVGGFDGWELNNYLDGTSVSSSAGFPASFNMTNTNYARTGIGAFRQPGIILAGTI